MNVEPYVKISTDTNGYALVEVLAATVDLATTSYKQTIARLIEDDFLVADPHDNEIKTSNENTKFQPTVTVKGRGESVVNDYVSELKRVEISAK